jgi:hypothetical protein
LIEFLKIPTKDRVEKQLIYYSFKIGDLIYYNSMPRTGLMGDRITKYPLMELFTFPSQKYKKVSRKAEFWASYYRQNNYFYDNNKTLFDRVRNKSSINGIEALSAQEAQSTVEQKYQKFAPVLTPTKLKRNFLVKKNKRRKQSIQSHNPLLMDQIFNSDGDLSKWGVRAASLNDIIRYLSYMRFDLKNICMICDEVRDRYEMRRKLAREVFRETEGEFCIRGYGRIEGLRGLRGVNLEDKIAKIRKRANEKKFLIKQESIDIKFHQGMMKTPEKSSQLVNGMGLSVEISDDDSQNMLKSFES